MDQAQLRHSLESTIPPPMLPLLHRIGGEGERRGIPVYLVGGVVRDLLMNALEREKSGSVSLPHGREEVVLNSPVVSRVPPAWDADLDLVTEGDAVAFARELAPLLSAAVKAHDRFGTATLTFPEGSHIDLTTARRESYSRPGALPVVELGASLEEDLFRRDFTLNAMAVRLGEPFGELIDPFGGRMDLRNGALRVLHPHSFIDDPTRIMRGARFEARFGFRMEPETRHLALEAVRDGRLETVTQDRLRRELMLGLEESSPWACAERWEDLGILRSLHPELRTEEDRLRRIADVLRWFASLRQKETPDRTLLYLTALLSPLPPPVAQEVCVEKLGLPPPKTERLVRCLEQGPNLAEAAPALDPPALTKRLKSEKLEVILYAAALDPSAWESLGAYFQVYRHTKLGFTGNDLLAQGYRPGPEFGAALEATLDEKLRGRLKTRRKEWEYLLAKLEEQGVTPSG
ncbi:MAG: hypothetical protein KY468_04025 [Armatimonadetes bacterium]|nr:hypothetical protein [Armatimonadota bacterium]